MEGHTFRLKNFESDDYQVLNFIKKEEVDGEFKTVSEGTTNEVVLQVLIRRLYYLQDKTSCRENAIAITKLEEALMWLNSRTADRESRGVEGTPKE